MNPFGSEEMAAGYAASRPPVHPLVIERAFRRMGRSAPFRRALDVGCGAGVSTRALLGYAEQRIGLEPAGRMLQWAGNVAPGAMFVVGAAEAIPLVDGAVDLVAAAGSLNYVELPRFFAEAGRVLIRDGVLLVYDFSAGKSFRDSGSLDNWFAEFFRRYPPPAREARDLSPAILAEAANGFRVSESEQFEIPVLLPPEFYLDYVMTETNVAAAVRNGAAHAEIRRWCAESLAPVWKGEPREVIFRGYFAVLRATEPGKGW